MLTVREKTILRGNVALFIGFIVVFALAAAILAWNPFGWRWSMAIAGCLYVFGSIAAGALVARSRKGISEEEMIKLEDKLMGLDKEPKNWWFMP